MFSPATGLYLGIRNEQLRWVTLEGLVVLTPQELAAVEQQRAEQAWQHAEQERQRAEQAERLLALYRQRFGEMEDQP